MLYGYTKCPRVTLILIVDDYAEFFELLDMRVESRLNGYQPIEFQKYTHDQLVTILQFRIDRGVRPGVVDECVVNMIVDVSENDARKAIDNLRKAIDRAIAEGLEEVTDEIVSLHSTVARTSSSMRRSTV